MFVNKTDWSVLSSYAITLDQPFIPFIPMRFNFLLRPRDDRVRDSGSNREFA